MNKSQLCDGNNLESVCSSIRASGAQIDSLDTKVGGNAGYRVNYFERVARPESTTVAMSNQSHVKSMTTLTNSGQVEEKDSPERRRGTSNTRVGPHACSNQALSTTNLPSPVPAKTLGGTRPQPVDNISCCHGIKRRNLEEGNTSIESAMSRLECIAREAGMVRESKRFKSTQVARNPHND